MKLDIREAAAMLNLSETKLYRLVDDGEIPFVTIQHHPLFHRLELLEWAMEQDMAISVDLYEDPTDAPFVTALERGGGHLLTAAGVSQIADDLPLAATDRAVIADVLAARGSEMFQVRNRVAVPTPKNPLICPEIPPTVMLWWARGEPVRVGEERADAVFAFATPTILDHLRLLARLLLMLRDSGFTQAVKRVYTIASVIDEARRVEQAIDRTRTAAESPPP